MTKHNKGYNVPKWILKSREKWLYTGRSRPPFAKTPKPGQRSVWDFPRPPALIPSIKEVKVLANGVQLAFSSNALELLETASPPTYYIPPGDILIDLLVPIPNRSSLCEWKGKAN